MRSVRGAYFEKFHCDAAVQLASHAQRAAFFCVRGHFDAPEKREPHVRQSRLEAFGESASLRAVRQSRTLIFSRRDARFLAESLRC